MGSYAVLWQDDDGLIYSGRAELDRGGLALHGGIARAAVRRYIPNALIDRVDRSARDLGPCRALELVTRDGRSLLVAAPFAVGDLRELHDRLAHRIERPGAGADRAVGPRARA